MYRSRTRVRTALACLSLVLLASCGGPAVSVQTTTTAVAETLPTSEPTATRTATPNREPTATATSEPTATTEPSATTSPTRTARPTPTVADAGALVPTADPNVPAGDPGMLPGDVDLRPDATFPQAAVQSALAQAGGTFGVMVVDVATGRIVYASNETTSFSAASLIKLPIVMTVYKLADQGTIDLQTSLTLEADDIVDGTGALQFEPVGSTYTIEDLAARSLRDSDNVAANMLIEYVGFEPINAFLAQANASSTHLGRLFRDEVAISKGRDNTTSPADMAYLLQGIVSGQFVSSSGKQAIVSALAQHPTDSPIAQGVSSMAIVAEKTGVLSGVEHAAAIVTPTDDPARAYILVVMSRDLPSGAAGRGVITEVSRQVYAAMLTPVSQQ